MPGAYVARNVRHVGEETSMPDYRIAAFTVESGHDDRLTCRRIERIDEPVDMAGTNTGHVSKADHGAVDVAVEDR